MAIATPIENRTKRDAEGFLIDPRDWNEDLATEIARENGISVLTDRHWQVIEMMRDAYFANGWSPSIRMLIIRSGLSIDDLCRLYPGAPGKVAAKVAGIPKPKGCV